uniref:BZIP domain-containing protein n=1 Tax=Oryza glumipatula TaxID=40148 RepID=A0A0E0AGJ1_9ORYZ
MEHVFAVDEIPDPLWAPPPPVQPAAAAGVDDVGAVSGGGLLERCPSGWNLERFLEELDGVPAPAASPDGAAIYPSPMPAAARGSRGYGDREAVGVMPMPAAALPAAPASAAMDPVEYNAMLKRKLDEDLATVAMWRASGAIHSESPLGNKTSLSIVGSILSSQKCIEGNGILVQTKLSPGPNGGSGPYVNQNTDAHAKQATSGSSREPSPSEDDDMEGDAEAMGNMILDEEDKVKKRKESNRESARRSRSRKAARLKDLEEQVSLLRVENSSLLRRLADANQKYSAAAIDNRVLMADIEALRAKVRMAEESVKMVTGARQLHQAIPDMQSPLNVNSDASVPIQNNNPMNYFSNANNAGVNSFMHQVSPAFQIVDSVEKIDPTDPVQLQQQQMASLQHLQNGACGGGASSNGYTAWGSSLMDASELVNMELQ